MSTRNTPLGHNKMPKLSESESLQQDLTQTLSALRSLILGIIGDEAPSLPSKGRIVSIHDWALRSACGGLTQDLPYIDRTRFKEEPNKPPTGFYSSDFMRRGEFTSTIRTEQYRDLLKAGHPCLYYTYQR